MCGIYGTTLQYPTQHLRDKLSRISFRGPDQLGLKQYSSLSRNIYFGHNRLAIVDLDPRSNQPFTYNNNIHIVFNGEIYNFKVLRALLTKKGHQFATTSDTEVICAAYLEYGENCVHHFNGMFAFVIYDEKKQILFGAKDRLGQKPFYYYLGNQGFEFASQVSAIQLHNKSLTISEKSIQEYLAWNSIPTPNSIFNEIKKLEDGYRFTYNLNSQSFHLSQYWDIKFQNYPTFNKSYENAMMELESLLTDAVNSRMYADVPLGVFLSGGVDSSLITALAVKASSQKVKTFSVKFDEKDYDESIYAKKVADYLNTEHNTIQCDYKEGLDLIENFSYYYDEPFADASAIPSMLLAKHTRKQVTVALSGDGADEAFLGYRRYSKLNKISKVAKIPLLFRKILAIGYGLQNKNKVQAIKPLLLAKNESTAYYRMLCDLNSSWKSSNFLTTRQYKYLNHNNKNFIDRASDFDLKTYLPWDINTKVDRATMAYSLEARSPFLDYRVIELAQQLPTDYKYVANNQKRILKDILYKHVPKGYFERTKSGFTMPFEVWFREDLKEKVLDELSFDALKEIPGIDAEITRKIIQEHLSGAWNHYPVIWKLLVLKQWLTNNANGFSIK